MFTALTYTYNLANAFSSKYLELTNFPWVLVYMFQHRFMVIAQVATFMCMSFAKVLILWQPGIYMRLNSRSTVNIATLFVVTVLTSDVIMRLDLHVLQNCEEKSQLQVYEIEFNRELSTPDGYDNSNLTLCEIYDVAPDVYPIGCKDCDHKRPLISILILIMMIFETAKFVLGFVRNFKQCSKRMRLRNSKSHVVLMKRRQDENLYKRSSAEKVQSKQIPKSTIIIVKEYNHASTIGGKLKDELTPPPTAQTSDVSKQFEISNHNLRILDSLNIDTKNNSPTLLRSKLIRTLSLPHVKRERDMFLSNPKTKVIGVNENKR